MIEIKDVAGLSGPLTKLIEVLSSGTGAIYRPVGIRREAKAQAEATRLLGNAQTEIKVTRSNAFAVAEALNTRILVEASEQIEDRAKARVIHREALRQANIEAIANAAASHMPQDVSEAPVDEDWKARFFNIAEDVSNSDMQDLWGRVLAGEVARPSSYSLRSLEVLRNLTKEEAEMFRHIRYLSTDQGSILKVAGTDLSAFGVTYQAILDLRAAGLVADNDMLKITFQRLGTHPHFVMAYNGKALLIEFKDPSATEIGFDNFALTRVGVELLSLIEPEPNRSYLQQVAERNQVTCILYLGEMGQPKEAFELIRVRA